MTEVEANRNVLRERIRKAGYVGNRDWANLQPLVPVEEFFAEGVNESAVGNSRIVQFGIAAFAALLGEIDRRDDVSDVVVEIDDDFDGGWPHCGYIFVATACSAAEIALWFAAIPPGLVLRAAGPFVRARVIRLEDIDVAPGYQLWALWWNDDMDEE